eukprot:scaffold2090_cov225-Prasinococcus_capsulatus_cf.AAC.35
MRGRCSCGGSRPLGMRSSVATSITPPSTSASVTRTASDSMSLRRRRPSSSCRYLSDSLSHNHTARTPHVNLLAN